MRQCEYLAAMPVVAEDAREPWHDFGHFGITHYDPEKQAMRAEWLCVEAGLGWLPTREYRSEWRPWSECDAEAFAVAGVGV